MKGRGVEKPEGLTVQELLEQVKDFGVSRSTLDYYIKQGLIPAPARVSQGRRGVRGLYSPAVVELIRQVRRYQAEGRTLAEIRDLLEEELYRLHLIEVGAARDWADTGRLVERQRADFATITGLGPDDRDRLERLFWRFEMGGGDLKALEAFMVARTKAQKGIPLAREVRSLFYPERERRPDGMHFRYTVALDEEIDEIQARYGGRLDLEDDTERQMIRMLGLPECVEEDGRRGLRWSL